MCVGGCFSCCVHTITVSTENNFDFRCQSKACDKATRLFLSNQSMSMNTSSTFSERRNIFSIISRGCAYPYGCRPVWHFQYPLISALGGVLSWNFMEMSWFDWATRLEIYTFKHAEGRKKHDQMCILMCIVHDDMRHRVFHMQFEQHNIWISSFWTMKKLFFVTFVD